MLGTCRELESPAVDEIQSVMSSITEGLTKAITTIQENGHCTFEKSTLLSKEALLMENPRNRKVFIQLQVRSVSDDIPEDNQDMLLSFVASAGKIMRISRDILEAAWVQAYQGSVASPLTRRADLNLHLVPTIKIIEKA